MNFLQGGQDLALKITDFGDCLWNQFPFRGFCFQLGIEGHQLFKWIHRRRHLKGKDSGFNTPSRWKIRVGATMLSENSQQTTFQVRLTQTGQIQWKLTWSARSYIIRSLKGRVIDGVCHHLGSFIITWIFMSKFPVTYMMRLWPAHFRLHDNQWEGLINCITHCYNGSSSIQGVIAILYTAAVWNTARGENLPKESAFHREFKLKSILLIAGICE